MAAPTDKVQLTKWETAAGGGSSEDESGFHEPLDPTEDAPEVRGVFLQFSGSDKLVYITRDASGNAIFRDAVGETEYTLEELAAGSAGITESQHRTLRQLIHFIADGPAEGFTSGAYRETTWSGVFPLVTTWWESSSKLKRITERTRTWTGVLLTTDAWDMYDTDGTTKLATVSDAITYSGVFEQNRTRTITIH